MRKTSFVVLVIAVSLLAGGHAAWAGSKGFYANVSADSQCTPGPNGARELLSVDADLIQKDAPSSGPYVSNVVFFLEQNLPKPSDLKQNDWKSIPASLTTQPVNKQFDLVAPGERYIVFTQTYPDPDYPVESVCKLVDPTANAVRAVVKITVDNANPNRTGGLVHTARCVSFPNPCRQ